MRMVKERIVRVARSMAPVLVRGESGSGKELVARAIHACSHRGDGPFVAVNCGAIPDNLIEAEFFGAKKGSYTGSTQDRDGYFKAATGGTLFLDEIGDLPLAMQSKLLRAIQERRVRPLGSTIEETLDVRVVSATHKDIGAQVLTGEFRQDLYYRLNVIEIMVPPLRDRRADLPVLCETLLRRIALESGLPVPSISPIFYDELAVHPLQGNVRELENLLHRAIALSDGEPLTGEVLEDCLPGSAATTRGSLAIAGASTSANGQLDLQAYLDNQERDILVKILQETGFNRTAAAQRLGLTLRQIRYRMQRLGITTPGGEEGPGSRVHAD
jgi:two-component system response regulator PilR (NtrC family)